MEYGYINKCKQQRFIHSIWNVFYEQMKVVLSTFKVIPLTFITLQNNKDFLQQNYAVNSDLRKMHTSTESQFRPSVCLYSRRELQAIQHYPVMYAGLALRNNRVHSAQN